ncbi:MAG: type II toxin-antitoxin system Phd/YefM family antitoxin [Gaiellaceae bacterium]
MVVRVGIRELRENLRSYLDQVKNGDEVLVTERGRPIARIVEPESHEATRARLIREGRVIPAKEPWPDIDVDALPDLGPGPTLSEIVIAMRRGVEF